MDLFNQTDPYIQLNKAKPLVGDQWFDFLPNNTLYELSVLIDRIDGQRQIQNFYPQTDMAFQAYRTLNPEDIKVVILSQSPYPNENSDGFAFSCARWITPSLRQIYYALTKDPDVLDEHIPFKHRKDLYNWVSQGIMLLNVKLIVKENDPSSLENSGWEEFTGDVINTLSRQYPDIIFLFWGGKAKEISNRLHFNSKYKMFCEHPVAASRENRYWNCNHFDKVNKIRNRNNQTPIQWI